MDRWIPSKVVIILSTAGQKKRNKMPVQTSEGQAEQVTSGSNEFNVECAVGFVNRNNATTVKEQLAW